MTENRPSLVLMGIASLALVALGGLRAAGASPNAAPALAAAIAVTVGLVAMWVLRAPNSRIALAGLALFNGVLGVAGALTPFVIPALAGAAYEPESDWLRNLDLTPPAIRWLRVATASGYFALALVVAGLAFFAAAYFLFRHGSGHRRHAH